MKLAGKCAAIGGVGDRFPVRGVLLGVLWCSVAFLALGCSELGAAPSTGPNIIFVLTDDLDLASVERMPALRSSLAEEGASFENAFVSQSLCCPSRATILTGLYAHHHGVKGNKPPDGGFEIFRSKGLEEDTIAVRLQELGYRTALFGKYLNGYPGDDVTYVPPGWDGWYAKLNEAALYEDEQEPREGENELYDYSLNENGQVVPYGSETEDYYTDVITRQATGYIRSTVLDPRPFFLYLAPVVPHLPATPAPRHEGAFAGEEAPRPPSFDEEDVSDKPSWTRETERISEEEASEIDDRYQKRLESMLAVDEMVASLVEELEAAGKLDNTYIFFTSDNGWLQGEHRIRKEKDRPYEESARVPLLVRGPGISPGSKVEELVLNTDFAPTFAELAGLGFPADGRSLAPLLRGEGPPSWRSAVLLEGFVGKRARVYEAVRTETHKYIEYGDGERELYDLSADPYELDSLHETADSSLLEDLKTRLDALKSCSGEGCREAEDAP